MQKTYLITGGAGFIGSNLAAYLLEGGHQVIVVDTLAGGKKENIPSGAHFHHIDITDSEGLAKISEGVDAIVHLAALPRVQFSIDHPLEAANVNVMGTISVLEAARKAKVKRVVFASSSAVYGDQDTLPFREDMKPNPKSPYALHKFMGEEMMKLWHTLHGLETVSLRFFNIYGPNMDPEGAYALVVAKFLKLRKEGKPLPIAGDGLQTRDFTHVRDLARAIMNALVLETVGRGEVINIGKGEGISIHTLAELIGGPVEYGPERIEPKYTSADSRRAKELLQWTPEIGLEEGIKELKKEYGIT